MRMVSQFAMYVAVGCASSLVFLSPPTALADSEDCQETLIVYDPHDLVWDEETLLDFDTLIEVEGLVDEYTERIDEAVDYESDSLEPPDGVSSDDLITEAQWEISDAIDLGRSIAGCDD
ncbi:MULTISPECIES: hypothetical protein [unclassified Mycolicibacterium]|uniref:hypothetical protein n=1 Tax=unclassified Mycolicibacterium TaxID=2636767 RepID=UPI0012DCD960|nr:MULTISPECIES: hypothetical protein [unclassified Mycolicibacterium]MUL85213.1 hypothetical protein [Mycolicibacterium sp. CBMA 329]MUL91180.1 hypothetical protein [Mycolicibacterium sp. CBMA 331]MUL98151.1 hypothetical protein [Mycolicibacterium sp. CBMA 334]MUM25749.1 hypothetical protein [Mycolicibacterium sp. CBMA 295]MUM40939.1 hypothetical protein [Mycolicibacterium sp. CBMA 247]